MCVSVPCPDGAHDRSERAPARERRCSRWRSSQCRPAGWRRARARIGRRRREPRSSPSCPARCRRPDCEPTSSLSRESPTEREATEPRGQPAIARRWLTSEPSSRVRDTRLASSASPSSCIGRASRREPRSRRPGGSSGSRHSTTRRRRPKGAFAPGWSRPTTAASLATSTPCAGSSRWRGGAPASSPSRPGTRRTPAQSPYSSSTRSPDCSTELSATRRPPRSRSRESTALSDRSSQPHRPRSWSWSS